MKRTPIKVALVISWLSVAVAADSPDLVVFQPTADSPLGRLEVLGEQPAHLLNVAADGRQVGVAELPAAWSRQFPVTRDYSIELLVLQGELAWQGEMLSPHDHAWLPAGASAPRVVAGAHGARILLFVDPPRDTDGDRAVLTHSAAIPWRPGTVALEDTGRALALEVKDLLLVPETGQRTWLLRLGADFDIPWEVHEDAEEGFLLDGDFRIGECLADGPVTGTYRPESYFYRPGGIAHSGPDAGTESGALWLFRTPKWLTVEFMEDCP